MPIGETNSTKTYGDGTRTAEAKIHRRSNFRDTAEIVSGIYAEEIGKLWLPVPGASLHCFQKRSTLDSSP